jgi:hypothetical protein
MSSAEQDREPLPNSLPRPAGELERLAEQWKAPRGWRMLSAVNNTYIGLLYIGTALLFLVLGGILALVVRTQLAVADNDFVEFAEKRQVNRRRNDKHFANSGEHQHRQRIIDHRLVEDRHELLRDGDGQRKQAGA